MDETGLAFSTEDLELQEKQNSAPDSGRRLLIRPTPAETEQIARDCPPRWALGPVIVDAIRRATGCSRATAYRADARATVERCATHSSRDPFQCSSPRRALARRFARVVSWRQQTSCLMAISLRTWLLPNITTEIAAMRRRITEYELPRVMRRSCAA